MVEKPEGKGALRRPRRRWVDNIVLGWNLERKYGVMWIELVWLRPGITGELL
jgi:hypothetical protein